MLLETGFATKDKSSRPDDIWRAPSADSAQCY